MAFTAEFSEVQRFVRHKFTEKKINFTLAKEHETNQELGIDRKHEQYSLSHLWCVPSWTPGVIWQKRWLDRHAIGVEILQNYVIVTQSVSMICICSQEWTRWFMLWFRLNEILQLSRPNQETVSALELGIIGVI